MLYVGTLEPRKNVPGLIRGYRELPHEIKDRYKLVITGKKGWYYDEIFDLVSSDEDLKKRVIFTGFVDDEDMMPIMKRAKVFAYISFYEGFGIPVIEGMASSVPTVTSYGSSLEEVAKDYPDVTLEHMLVDNCAMQLVRDPAQFDVILTENMFDDVEKDMELYLQYP